MSDVSKPIYAFIAGEVSPSFFGRTDLSKYDLGVQLAKNFFIDFRGGLSSRPGFKYVGPTYIDSKASKIFRFRANGNDYLLVFSDLSLQIIRNGGYLLQDTKTITGITGNVVTCAGHGYSVGNWVYISGVVGRTQVNDRYFQVSAATTNTFTIVRPGSGTLDSSAYGAYVSGGTCARVVRITTPYTAAMLSGLRLEQQYNRMILTTLDAPVYTLTYVDDLTWTLAPASFSSSVTTPSAPTLTPSAAGSAGIAFAVTAVKDGIESLVSPYAFTSLSVNYSATAGSCQVTWPIVPGIKEYNVYRSLILPTGSHISAAQELGYLGKAYGPQFDDVNITPDFTKTPPRNFNPFESGQIAHIEVTAGGSGYTNSTAVTVTGAPGSGFRGQTVVDSTGKVTGVVIISGGKGYVSPAVAFSVGTGATATASTNASSGNNPRIFKLFQQRGIYAGTSAQPMTIWGSIPGEIFNFNLSTVPNAGDAFSFTLDASDIKPILHMVALRSGLLLFTETTVTQLRAEEGKALSAVNALAEPQAYKGASLTPPAKIDLDVLFAQEKSSSVNAMMYTEYTNTFQLQDVSILSNHLMGEGKEITRMEWVPEPSKLLWCLREDGALLSLTYERAQEVFAWAQHKTRGRFTDICAISEDGRDVLYAVVERYLEGRWSKFIEVLQPRDFTQLDDYFGVDSGLSLAHEYPAVGLTFSAARGLATVTASGAVFTGRAGQIIYAGGGKAVIDSVTSATEAQVTILRPLTSVLFEDANSFPLPVLSGDWSIVAPTTTVSNLWHLEGETVSVLADGDAFTDLVVSGGSITLSRAASKISVGLGYTCQGQTLPLTVQGMTVEDRVKDVLGISARFKETRGLAFGEDFSHLVELKDRTDVDWGDPIVLRSEMASVSVNGGWAEDGTVCFQQQYPLPATILGLIISADIGDD